MFLYPLGGQVLGGGLQDDSFPPVLGRVRQEITINVVQSFTIPDLPGIVTPIHCSQSFNFYGQSGDEADQISELITTTLSFAAMPIVLDLMALRDPFGNLFRFLRIKYLCICLRDTTDGHTLKLGSTASLTDAWTSLISNPGQITLQPSTSRNSGAFLIMAPNMTGYPVTTHNRLLPLDPGTAAFSIDLWIAGCLN